MAKFEEEVRKNAGYIVVVALLIAYVLTKFVLFSLLCALSIVGIFVYETYKGVEEGGWKKELEEIIIAIVVGVAIWYGSAFLLHTPAPLDAVVSCSMLPHMDRGDMVILSGGGINTPAIDVSASEWGQIKPELQTNFTCGPCNQQGQFVPYNFSICNTGCNSCLIAINGKPVFSSSNNSFFSYDYALCKLKGEDGEVLNDVCVKAVTIKGETFEENFSNDVVVYEPLANSVFTGSTIHRVFLEVSVDGKLYYLTKGDNNEVLDVQAPNSGDSVGFRNGTCIFSAVTQMNHPAPQEDVRGKVIAKIPYLGYLKLFLWGYLGTPEGCGSVIESA